MCDDDVNEPEVIFPEMLKFVANKGTQFEEIIEVDSSDFSGSDDFTRDSATFSSDVSGHGTVELEVYADRDYFINPPALASVNSESGSLELHQDTIDEIQIILDDE